jgi:hypothetical protein
MKKKSESKFVRTLNPLSAKDNYDKNDMKEWKLKPGLRIRIRIRIILEKPGSDHQSEKPSPDPLKNLKTRTVKAQNGALEVYRPL